MQNNTARYLLIIALGNMAIVETVPPGATGGQAAPPALHHTPRTKESRRARLLQRARQGVETLRGNSHRTQPPTLPDPQADLPTTTQPAESLSYRPYLPLEELRRLQAPKQEGPEPEYVTLPLQQEGPEPDYATLPPQQSSKTEPGYLMLQELRVLTAKHLAPDEEEEQAYLPFHDWQTQEHPELLPYQYLTPLEPTRGEAYANVPSHILDAETSLRNLLSLGSIEGAEQFVKSGADPNIQADQANGNGNTLLHLAVRRGNRELVEWLLNQDGIRIDTKNHSGRTALHQAAIFSGNYEVAQLLIAAGAQLDVTDKNSHTPFYFAGLRRDQALMELLHPAHKE